MSVGVSSRPRTRRTAAVLLGLYAALLAVVLLSPTSATQSSLVSDLVRWMTGLGLDPRVVTYNRAEILMNVAIIAPLTFLASLVAPRIRWQAWTAYAFLGATSVEIVQGLLLPHRQASFSDIVANTAGALLGAVIAAPLRG